MPTHDLRRILRAIAHERMLADDGEAAAYRSIKRIRSPAQIVKHARLAVRLRARVSSARIRDLFSYLLRMMRCRLLVLLHDDASIESSYLLDLNAILGE